AEVLTAIDVPALPEGARWRYVKWTPRAREDKAFVGLAAALVMDGRRCRTARLAVGGVAASPVGLATPERPLEDQELDPAASARSRTRSSTRRRSRAPPTRPRPRWHRWTTSRAAPSTGTTCCACGCGVP